MHLLDINVWLGLAFDSHMHHESAKDWFARVSPGSCAFCRLTQQGFLRLATTPRVLAEDAVTLAEAWRMYDGLFSDPRVVYCDEPEGIEPVWRTYTERRSFSPKVWNDAYLAAFARVAGYELVTFDQGFTQFKDLSCTILS
jgi:uncharacterized protein